MPEALWYNEMVKSWPEIVQLSAVVGKPAAGPGVVQPSRWV